MAMVILNDCPICSDKNACFRLYVEDCVGDIAKCYTWHKDESYAQENTAISFKILTDLHEATKEYEGVPKDAATLTYIPPPRQSKKFYSFDTLFYWVDRYNLEVAQLKELLKKQTRETQLTPASTPTNNPVQQESRKRRLSGIALLDYMLAQRVNTPSAPREPLVQVQPPAKRAKRSAEIQEAAPLRRSKRIANCKGSQKDEALPPPQKKRRGRKKSKSNEDVAQAELSSAGKEEVLSQARVQDLPGQGQHLLVPEDSLPLNCHMTLEEKITQYFQSSDPDAVIPEDYCFNDGADRASETSWTDLSDRMTNPNYRPGESSIYYDDSMQSCDSEVASNDDSDLCPSGVHNFVAGQLQATLSGDFDRLPDEPHEFADNIGLRFRMKFMLKSLQNKGGQLLRDYVTF